MHPGSLRLGLPLLLAVVLLGAAAPSQGGSHKWWASTEMQRELGLTKQQSDEIERIFQATLPQLRAAKDELDRQEATLSRMVAESAVSEAVLIDQIDRVEAARGTLGKNRTLMLFRMRRVLTPEQRLRLKELHERGQRRHTSDDRRH